MEDESVPGLGDRIRTLLGTVWQERQIIIRSDGRVRHVTLGRSAQLAVMLPVLAAAGGAGWLGYGLVAAKNELAAQERRHMATEAAYLDLLTEVADYEKTFAAITRDMESNEVYLLKVLEENAAMQKEMAGIQQELKSTEVDRAETVIAREALKGRSAAGAAELTEAVTEHEHLEALIDRMRAELRESEIKRAELAGSNDLLIRRVEDFQGRVRLLNSAKTKLEARVETLQTDLTDTRAKLANDIAAAAADAERRIADLAARHDTDMAEQKESLERLLDNTRATLTAELQEARAERGRLAQIRDMLNRSLEATELELAAVFADKDRLQSTLGELHDQLVLMEEDRKAVVAERDRAADRLRSSELALALATDHNLLVEQQLEAIETALHGALELQGEISAEKRALEDHVAAMERSVADLNESHLALLDNLAERTESSVRWIEDTLARTGLDLDDLIVAVLDRPKGQGGPFQAIAGDNLPKPIEQTASKIDSDITRWEGLQRLLTRLPLNEPVDYGRETSGFGPRKDPINGKTAFHAGIDIAAPRRTPVYATAAGKVEFAGWKGNFGRMVVVDHGFGIETRYAHLQKIFVKVGQTVDFRKKIGLVGNSGRSTGTHVHYEVVLNGKNLDPAQFVSAGRHVFKD